MENFIQAELRIITHEAILQKALRTLLPMYYFLYRGRAHLDKYPLFGLLFPHSHMLWFLEDNGRSPCQI